MGAIAAERTSSHSAMREHRRDLHAQPARKNAPAVSPLSAHLIQRKPGCACGGGCSRCAASHRSNAPQGGTRLTVNTPGDAYEQEADRLADQVMRMADPAPAVSAPAHLPSRVQRKCSACQRRDDEEEMLQAKESPGGVPHVSADTARRIDSLRGGGAPLEPSLRRFFEPRFDQDLSGVRVHTDSHAAETARAVSAQAYTIGSDIVFDSGRYAPETSGGMALIAHELVHVLQQRSGAVARKVQRLPNVATDFQTPATSARACLVHLHSDERTAFAAANNIRRRFCTNLVFLENNDRCVRVSPTCSFDPNRIFDAARPERGFTAACTCPTAERPGAISQINTLRTSLNAALATCGTDAAGGELPMVAFHNNTPGGGLSIDEYSPGGNEAAAAETDAARLTPPGASAPVANPAIQTVDPANLLTDHDNFFLTTNPADFFALRGAHNVALQKANPPDDGSLSIAMRNRRYMNIEVEDAETQGNRIRAGNTAALDRRRALLATDISMGERVMSLYGIPPGPCPAPPAQGGAAPGSAPGSSLMTLGAAIGRFAAQLLTELATTASQAALQAIIQLIQRGGLGSGAAAPPAPMPREATSLPRESTSTGAWTSCRSFFDQTDFDAGKRRWGAVIAAMPVHQVIGWIIGRDAPPSAARNEAQAQLDCMLAALRTAAAANPTLLQLPRTLSTVRGHASDSDQARIWERKFNFTRRPVFDRITPDAVRTCGPQIGAAGGQWDPQNECHRVCWGVLATPANPACALPSGRRALTPEERQREILEASSAPGISRHHYGTDFDLFSVNPADWQRTGSTGFADEHSWLVRNASTYGFVQTFITGSAGSMGYMPEDWHWSYMPIAQALLEFAQVHQNSVASGESLEDALMQRWGPGPQFSHIRRNWRSFVFNVNQTPTF